MASRPWRYLAGLVAVAAGYFAAAKLGLSLAFLAEQVTVVWPASGIALAVLLLFGCRQRVCQPLRLRASHRRSNRRRKRFHSQRQWQYQ